MPCLSVAQGAIIRITVQRAWSWLQCQTGGQIDSALSEGFVGTGPGHSPH